MRQAAARRVWNAETRDEMRAAGPFAYPQRACRKKGKNKGIGLKKAINKTTKKMGVGKPLQQITKGVDKVANDAAKAAKCAAMHVAIKGLLGAKKVVKGKYANIFEFCFFPLDIRSETTGSCGVKEKEAIDAKMTNIRNDNEDCFKEWFKKQKKKEEGKAGEDKNSYLPAFLVNLV